MPEAAFTAALVIPLDGAGVEHDATSFELDGWAVDAVRGIVPIVREGRGRRGSPVGESDTGNFRGGGSGGGGRGVLHGAYYMYILQKKAISTSPSQNASLNLTVLVLIHQATEASGAGTHFE